jgi:hypothetical protein
MVAELDLRAGIFYAAGCLVFGVWRADASGMCLSGCDAGTQQEDGAAKLQIAVIFGPSSKNPCIPYIPVSSVEWRWMRAAMMMLRCPLSPLSGTVRQLRQTAEPTMTPRMPICKLMLLIDLCTHTESQTGAVASASHNIPPLPSHPIKPPANSGASRTCSTSRWPRLRVFSEQLKRSSQPPDLPSSHSRHYRGEHCLQTRPLQTSILPRY